MPNELATRTFKLNEPLDGHGSLAIFLDKKKESIAELCDKTLTADRLIKLVHMSATRVPKLALCTPGSLLTGILTAAQLKLEIGGPLGHCHLVPFNNKGILEAQFIMGYRGMIELSYRSGLFASIETRLVYEGEEFSYEENGEKSRLRHVPNLWAETDRKLLGVYAVSRLNSGGWGFEAMSLRQVKAIQARSKNGDQGPWITDFPEMSRKTVLRRIWKVMPTSIEMRDAMEADGDRFVDTDDAPEAIPTPRGTSAVLARVRKVNDANAAQTLVDATVAAAETPGPYQPQTTAENAQETPQEQTAQVPGDDAGEIEGTLTEFLLRLAKLTGLPQAGADTMLNGWIKLHTDKRNQNAGLRPETRRRLYDLVAENRLDANGQEIKDAPVDGAQS